MATRKPALEKVADLCSEARKMLEGIVSVMYTDDDPRGCRTRLMKEGLFLAERIAKKPFPTPYDAGEMADEYRTVCVMARNLAENLGRNYKVDPHLYGLLREVEKLSARLREETDAEIEEVAK